jgi:hypothetical protein
VLPERAMTASCSFVDSASLVERVEICQSREICCLPQSRRSCSSYVESGGIKFGLGVRPGASDDCSFDAKCSSISAKVTRDNGYFAVSRNKRTCHKSGKKSEADGVSILITW